MLHFFSLYLPPRKLIVIIKYDHFIISSFINNQTKRVETNRVSTLSLIGKTNYIKTHTIKYAE